MDGEPSTAKSVGWAIGTELELASDEQLGRLVQFVKAHCYLFDRPNVRFFTDGRWKEIPPEWVEYLSSLNNNQLNSFPFCESQQDCPQTLQNFLRVSRELSVLHASTAVSHLPDFELDEKRLKNSRIKAKKEHELKRLTGLIVDLCEKQKVNRIVDVGCGVGHLLGVLTPRFTLVGLECNERMCATGRQRYSFVQYENIYLSSESIFDRNVMKLFTGEQDDKTAIVSLHGCGDLQPLLLRIYAKLPRERVPLIFTVPCCYHKMSNLDAEVSSWAMSHALKAHCPQGWVLPRSALRLACQQQLSRWQCSSASRARHTVRFAQRALLECLYDEKGILVDKWPRRLHRSFNSVEDLASTIIHRLELCGNHRDEIEASYRRIYKENCHLFSVIEPFTVLQAIMQLPLELLILWDRLRFIIEEGARGCLKVVFDSAVSPRNFCIIGLPNGS